MAARIDSSAKYQLRRLIMFLNAEEISLAEIIRRMARVYFENFTSHVENLKIGELMFIMKGANEDVCR